MAVRLIEFKYGDDLVNLRAIKEEVFDRAREFRNILPDVERIVLADAYADLQSTELVLEETATTPFMPLKEYDAYTNLELLKKQLFNRMFNSEKVVDSITLSDSARTYVKLQNTQIAVRKSIELKR